MMANQLDRDAGDQPAMSNAIAALEEGAPRDRAKGFCAFVAVNQGAWPTGVLAAADRGLLRTVEMAAKEGDLDGRGAVLDAELGGDQPADAGPPVEQRVAHRAAIWSIVALASAASSSRRLFSSSARRCASTFSASCAPFSRA